MKRKVFILACKNHNADNSSELQELLDDNWEVESSCPLPGAGYNRCMIVLKKNEEILGPETHEETVKRYIEAIEETVKRWQDHKINSPEALNHIREWLKTFSSLHGQFDDRLSAIDTVLKDDTLDNQAKMVKIIDVVNSQEFEWLV